MKANRKDPIVPALSLRKYSGLSQTSIIYLQTAILPSLVMFIRQQTLLILQHVCVGYIQIKSLNESNICVLQVRTQWNIVECCCYDPTRSTKVREIPGEISILYYFFPACLKILLFCLKRAYKRVEPFYFFSLQRLLPIHLLYPCFKLSATFTITKLVNSRIEVIKTDRLIARSSLSLESFIIITNYECVQLNDSYNCSDESVISLH